MTEYSLLERTLSKNLAWNRARIKFLARFVVALFAAKTVNLSQIATFFAGRASVDSKYKRIKRFLRFCSMSEREVAQLVIRLMKLSPPFVITIDRTEWQLGKTWVNVTGVGSSFARGRSSSSVVDGILKERLHIGFGTKSDLRKVFINLFNRKH